MEALGLTPEQLEVVTARGGDVLVTAGAGSGKTRVLVERYLALLNECTIPELVAVTFTDAAATEMRQRVRRAVMERPELAAHRSTLDEASIGTIHAFCRQLLRQFAFESAIDPAAPILADDEAEFELLAACLDALEAAAAGTDGDALRAVRAITPYSLTIMLPELVARRDEVHEAFDALPLTREEREVHIRARITAISTDTIEAARSLAINNVADLLGYRLAGDPDILTQALDALVAALGDDPETLEPDQFVDRLLEVKIALNGGRKANWGADVPAIRAHLREIREHQELLTRLPRWNEHDEASLEILDGLRVLFDDACARYESRKHALGALDYLDLELHAARLLETHPEVARRCRETFRQIMVDEVQDTSPLQMRVLRLLGGRDLYDGHEVGNGAHPRLFLVGDAKQAIYRFRGSDVRAFNRSHTAIEANGGSVLRLSQSFRTHDELGDALNHLFAVVLGVGSEDYEAPMQQMTGRGLAGTRAPHLTLLPIGNATSNSERATDDEARRVEADLVASEIARVLAETDQVWDNDQREYRKPTYRDVAVLLRRLKNVHLFELALEAHGLPYRTPAGAGFFTRQEVLDCTNLLAWLAEPDDTIALVGALRSPFFLLDDLTLLRLAERTQSEPAAWLHALADPPADVNDPELRARCLHAFEVLAALRDEAAHASVDALLESALRRTAFEASWASLQGGDQALANIRKFVGMARTLAGRSLDEFVAYVQRRRDDLAAREGQAVLDDSDAVRLLTVHGAKGLDFPIVFIPEAHVDARGDWPAVRFRSDEGVAYTLARDPESDETTRGRSGFYSLLHRRDEEEDRAEHRRLLYVAATRAADSLVISGGDRGGWMRAMLDAYESMPGGARGAIEVREPAPVDVEAVTRRQPPRVVAVPDEADEVEYAPPLVDRPPLIPLRASTPVTALRPREEETTTFAHGDGLAQLRGVLAHRAIELTYTRGARPNLLTELASIDEGALDAESRERVTSEVAAMLDAFDASELATTLRDPATDAWFEFPFAWDWDGVPVHGTLDLLYRRDGAYHIVDFKTDDLRGRDLAIVAHDYLAQLGLYAGAVERATGAAPTTALYFLRTGERYAPAREDIESALARTRAEIDAGLLRAIAPDPFEEPSE